MPGAGCKVKSRLNLELQGGGRGPLSSHRWIVEMDGHKDPEDPESPEESLQGLRALWVSAPGHLEPKNDDPGPHQRGPGSERETGFEPATLSLGS